ncbi:MAG: UDP-N-acetylglucosamine 1-carboxyvinyltransferase [Rubrobacteraceae bacterium]|uniref:UDP-N-acetylglucosamine 1-carboxyvinyltransferase n=1 Tax=Rubrobacter naiadicus TaxID=1392641 RepID=UPI00235FC7B1|nr:UDP-N-acetylglucosamine 1-carboxyvinyltransferase [Rubrobacter naiadicus]MBX6762695.1 UDP-N-acetylglucosamine 1-carboxyvinyltransferase [Rubrobacteraceae bacterium]MCL6439760.1 UDP-N-acetylglucosamine 1-carboxyvinyltransferase [Rubrobacteraceae bacterium]
MERFVVEGGGGLYGEVEVSGAKNLALKLMAASLLAAGRTVLHNVPHIRDVETMRAVLDELGAPSEFYGSTLEIYGGSITSYTAPYELVRQMRASLVVLGPLVSRFGQAEVSAPGGCNLGLRKFNFHLDGLRRLGADIELDHGFIKASAPHGLRGAEVFFDYPSVTATENIMMAAVLASGTTIVENGAREPEVVELARFLNAMGARIRGAGTGRIVIEGVEELHPVEFAVMPDRIESGTFIMAAAAAGGDVNVKNAVPEHLKMELEKLREMGAELDFEPGKPGVRVRVEEPAELSSVDISTLPFPGFATDHQAQMMVLLTQVSGVGIITENIFENRFQVAEELNRMGAGIDLFGGHRALVRGPKRLSGTVVQAPELRGGAALVMAGLVASGTTVVEGAHHILRGYERLDEKLSSLGASVSFEAVDAPALR